jgi:hypothetical protein
MSLVRTILWIHEIKRYASKLPEQLAKNYGAGNYYTLAQIDITIDELKLDPALRVYGYAMCLSEEQFEAQRVHMASEIGYKEARAAVLQYVHHMPSEVEFSKAGRGIVGIP